MGSLVQFDRRSITAVVVIGFVAAGLRFLTEVAPVLLAKAETVVKTDAQTEFTVPMTPASSYTCAKLGTGCAAY